MEDKFWYKYTSLIQQCYRWLRYSVTNALLALLLSLAVGNIVLSGRENEAVRVGLVGDVNLRAIPTALAPSVCGWKEPKACVIGLIIAKAVIVGRGDLQLNAIHDGITRNRWQSEYQSKYLTDRYDLHVVKRVLSGNKDVLFSDRPTIVSANNLNTGWHTTAVLIGSDEFVTFVYRRFSDESKECSLLSDILNMGFFQGVVHRRKLLVGDPSVISSSTKGGEGGPEQATLHPHRFPLNGIIVFVLSFVLGRISLRRLDDNRDRSILWDCLFVGSGVMGAVGVFLILSDM